MRSMFQRTLIVRLPIIYNTVL
uniref:Uncharacterized protein n=1 Tax=Romanomermis culicivorax TaxID=13658 RepID=A0A915KLB8_ROMCU